MALSFMCPILRRVSPAFSLTVLQPRRLPTGTVGLGLSSQPRDRSNASEMLALERLKMWYKESFLQSEVSQTEVDKSVEALQDAKVDIKADSLEGTGDIKEFEGIDWEKFPALVKSLQDEIPKKIINAINGALLMETSSEAVFTWKLAGGKLEYLYFVQILALKYATEKGEKVDILMAHYEIKVEGASEGAEGVTGSERKLQLSISQMERLRQFVEISAESFWKKKAEQVLLAETAKGTFKQVDSESPSVERLSI